MPGDRTIYLTPDDVVAQMRAEYLAMSPAGRRAFRYLLPIMIWPCIAGAFVVDVVIGVGGAFRDATLNAATTRSDYRRHRADITKIGD